MNDQPPDRAAGLMHAGCGAGLGALLGLSVMMESLTTQPGLGVGVTVGLSLLLAVLARVYGDALWSCLARLLRFGR
ncbi:MAG: hypothetical protein AAF533_01220 [Acidobacteriota bacterium]